MLYYDVVKKIVYFPFSLFFCNEVTYLIFDSLCQCRLRYCGMTSEGCSAVTSALNSNPSHLREMNLSANQLGFENLGVLLRNHKFKLEILVLVICSFYVMFIFILKHVT